MNLLQEDSFYEQVVRQAIALLGCDNASLLLKDGEAFQRKYSTLSYSVTPRKVGFTSECLSTNTLAIPQKEKVWEIHPEHRKLQSFLIVPLDSIGVLYFSSYKKDWFNPSHITSFSPYRFYIAKLLAERMATHTFKKKIDSYELFLSLLSHEIKTPLTALQLYSDMLLRTIDKKKLPNLSLATSFHHELHRISGMIDDYVDQKLEYKKHTVILCELVGQVILEERMVHPNYHIRFTNYVSVRPARVLGDKDKLMQAVINVINNAIKFSPVGSTISIVLREQTDSYCVCVQDQGKGMRKEEVSRVFEKFYKGDSKADGLGLGLYLVKNIIHTHNGEIAITSDYGKGTKVELSIPKVS